MIDTEMTLEVPVILPLHSRSEAGRRGAQRLHQLIQRGRQYEDEHGLKKGKQRLRQLVQQGKRYEQEHGLSRTHTPRVGRHQAWVDFTKALARIVQPAYRPGVERLAVALQQAGTANEPA